MVREIEKNGQTLFLCELCGFTYKEKKWAEKCQQWCQEHQSCNLKITQHAVRMVEPTQAPPGKDF